MFSCGGFAENSQPSRDIVDPRGQDGEKRLGVRDLLEHLLCNLRTDDRQLLEMYYADGLTFTEIGEAIGITQSTACVRHATLLRQLRRRAMVAAGFLTNGRRKCCHDNHHQPKPDHLYANHQINNSRLSAPLNCQRFTNS